MTWQKNNGLLTLAITFLLSVYAFNSHAFSYRDNEVSLKTSTGYSIKSASFTIRSHKIHKDQDPDNKIKNGKKVKLKSNKFKFRIGRKGSESVAKWFNSRISSSKNTFGHDAGKLNFAMIGDLKIKLSGGDLFSDSQTFTFSDIALAQGHTGSRNNWWFGGKSCDRQKKLSRTVRCIGLDTNSIPVAFEFKRGGNSVSEVRISKVSLVDTRNWMASLVDGTTFSNIVMPGSHDAGVSRLKHCSLSGVAATIIGVVVSDAVKVATQTQDISISEQLKAGSRYFDLRVDYDHGELVTYHRRSSDGKGCNGQSIKDVLDQTVSFLEEHTKETVILKFSHFRGSDGKTGRSKGHAIIVRSKLNKLVKKSKYRSMFYDFGSLKESSVNLATRDIKFFRGRIIPVFADFDDYLDSTSGLFKYKGSCSKGKPNLAVCDKYSAKDNYKDMKSDQLKKWKKYGGLGSNYLYLLSWTLTPSSSHFNIGTMADEANANLADVLNEEVPSLGLPNIVYVDFMDENLGQLIARYNFK